MTHSNRAVVAFWTIVTIGALFVGPLIGFIVGQASGQNSVEVDDATLLEGRANNCRTGALAALGQLDGEGVDQLLTLSPETADDAISDLAVLPDACLIDGVEVPDWIAPTLAVAADAARDRVASAAQ